jgi:hypothetical protein
VLQANRGTSGTSAADAFAMSMKPGYTVSPVPSMTTASTGAATAAPASSTSPSRMTIVAASTGGPAIVTIRALRIAYTRPGATCAWNAGTAKTVTRIAASDVMSRAARDMRRCIMSSSYGRAR